MRVIRVGSGLPGDLCFEMIALEREIDEGTGTEPAFADLFAERGCASELPPEPQEATWFQILASAKNRLFPTIVNAPLEFERDVGGNVVAVSCTKMDAISGRCVTTQQ